MSAASMTLNDRFTFISNMVALAAVAVLALVTLGSKTRGEAS
jgi:Tfp pilus assembly protein PilE